MTETEGGPTLPSDTPMGFLAVRGAGDRKLGRSETGRARTHAT